MSDESTLSAGEVDYRAKVWLCFKENPTIEFDKLASELGITNSKSAANGWAKIKKKITAEGGAVMKAPAPAKGTKKRAVEEATEDAPAPKKRTGGRKKKEASPDAAEADEEEAPAPAPKKRGGRKKKVDTAEDEEVEAPKAQPKKRGKKVKKEATPEPVEEDEEHEALEEGEQSAGAMAEGEVSAGEEST